MMVYVLEFHISYEADMLEGVFSTLEGAKNAAEAKAKNKLTWHENKEKTYWREENDDRDHYNISLEEVKP